MKPDDQLSFTCSFCDIEVSVPGVMIQMQGCIHFPLGWTVMLRCVPVEESGNVSYLSRYICPACALKTNIVYMAPNPREIPTRKRF